MNGAPPNKNKNNPNKELDQDEEERILTLAQALKAADDKNEPCQHRDMELCRQAMPNFRATPGGPHGGVPMSFCAAWDLPSRPRRIALLLDDCQEEYRDFATPILPHLIQLTQAFRKNQQPQTPIVWSSWSRRFDDGIANAMDRWYGPRGLENPYTNALYIVDGCQGMQTLQEIAPTDTEIEQGWFYHSKHLDMFWCFTPDGRSYLDSKLKEHGIDTIVVAGLWTDECILSTAFAGLSRGYDVVVVRDAVATATANGEAALTVLGGTCSKVLTTQQVVDYLEGDGFVLGKVGAVKGTQHPDGRLDG